MLEQYLTLPIMKQRLLPKGKCKKVLALIKDELGGQIMR